MKIITFNTQHCCNYIQEKINLGAVAEVIRDYDIIGLNEIRGKGCDTEYQNQLEILAELTGIKNYYFAKAFDVDGKNPYGNAILSKIPIIKVETIPIPNPETKKYDGWYEPRCILKAKLQNGYTVFICHFGLNPDEQENAVAQVLVNLENEKCILMGDFNVEPEDKVLLPIRARMKDAAELFEKERLSIPSDIPERKIDYIFVSTDIKITSADIPQIVVSDHRPHIAEIKNES